MEDKFGLVIGATYTKKIIVDLYVEILSNKEIHVHHLNALLSCKIQWKLIKTSNEEKFDEIYLNICNPFKWIFKISNWNDEM
jgi:hypothetical protein